MENFGNLEIEIKETKEALYDLSDNYSIFLNDETLTQIRRQIYELSKLEKMIKNI